MSTTVLKIMLREFDAMNRNLKKAAKSLSIKKKKKKKKKKRSSRKTT